MRLLLLLVLLVLERVLQHGWVEGVVLHVCIWVLLLRRRIERRGGEWWWGRWLLLLRRRIEWGWWG